MTLLQKAGRTKEKPPVYACKVGFSPIWEWAAMCQTRRCRRGSHSPVLIAHRYRFIRQASKILFMIDKVIRILVADDHPIVRQSIVALLNREPDMEVVGTAVNGRDAIETAQTTHPDVIVMDISMPELDGIRAAGEILQLGLAVPIIMLSMHHNSALVKQARKNGAVGYVVKQRANDALIPAIRAASAGSATL